MPLRLRVISDGNALAPEERLREFAAAGGTIGRHSDNDWVLTTIHVPGIGGDYGFNGYWPVPKA